MDAIIFMGLQASGKSSFFKEYFYDTHIRINLDMLHTRFRENLLFSACLDMQQSFVIDNTNPTKEDRQRYILPASARGAKIIGYYFQSNISDCILRNQKRIQKKTIPTSALKAVHSKLQLPEYQEGFEQLFYVHINNEGQFIVEEWNDEI